MCQFSQGGDGLGFTTFLNKNVTISLPYQSHLLRKPALSSTGVCLKRLGS